MPRYIDMDKLSKMIEVRAEQLIEGKEALLYVAKWLNLLPEADVVPKSEVERLQEDVDRLQEINNRQVENIKLAKAEVAREIFEAIEDDCFDQFGYLDYDAFFELKKKYQEGERYAIHRCGCADKKDIPL